ncbi:hypothetical protein OIU79_015981 [Salix purpurea]|uniref:Uncharacterized protein n=1 Tax=Salix purpurea TaxID=77065 RepID=A0A9Q0SR66_SALPP|nr:hypothetical protein OIU79_015981 [Salix purpurea]
MKASPPGQEKARPPGAKPNSTETGIASFNLGAAWDGGKTRYGERQFMLTVHVERKHANPPLQTWRTDLETKRGSAQHASHQMQEQAGGRPKRRKSQLMQSRSRRPTLRPVPRKGKQPETKDGRNQTSASSTAPKEAEATRPLQDK